MNEDVKEKMLTPQERKIFTMLLDGKMPKEIAHELKITYNTVLTHQKSIYRKLEVQSINQLLVKFRPITRSCEVKKPIFPRLHKFMDRHFSHFQ